uniref:Bm8747 n=1 Tax=Brugia malayi TaxID=6279 RepID=A0A1I9G852_BRUMA|nr:Bm8747 [Brugia malayi]
MLRHIQSWLTIHVYDTQTHAIVNNNSYMHDGQTGVLETFVSLGSTAGPLFGGVLYEIGFQVAIHCAILPLPRN